LASSPDGFFGHAVAVDGDTIVVGDELLNDVPVYLQDSGHDGRADRVDNCGSVANVDQANLDGDARGDACDADDALDR
jgi:hypothetical protein